MQSTIFKLGLFAVTLCVWKVLILKSASIDNSARKAKKSKNSKGDPIRRPSKILAVTDDSETSAEDRAIFIAIATGCVERISLQVCKKSAFGFFSLL